jgi:hypothetical protein
MRNREMRHAGKFQVSGTNATPLFTLKLHRGDSMTLVGMNWKKGRLGTLSPFAIEYNGSDRIPLP